MEHDERNPAVVMEFLQEYGSKDVIRLAERILGGDEDPEILTRALMVVAEGLVAQKIREDLASVFSERGYQVIYNLDGSIHGLRTPPSGYAPGVDQMSDPIGVIYENTLLKASDGHASAYLESHQALAALRGEVDTDQPILFPRALPQAPEVADTVRYIEQYGSWKIKSIASRIADDHNNHLLSASALMLLAEYIVAADAFWGFVNTLRENRYSVTYGNSGGIASIRGHGITTEGGRLTLMGLINKDQIFPEWPVREQGKKYIWSQYDLEQLKKSYA